MVKNIPLKIFIMILIAGIIGIVGVSILTIDITMLSNIYNDVNEYTKTLETTNSIRAQMYKHQSFVSKHISADEKEKLAQYETEAKEIEESLKAEFSELREKMMGGEREQIYHEAYTNFIAYISAAEKAFMFSNTGQDNTANYYVVYVMDASVVSVSEAFDKLDAFAEAEITEANDKMNSFIRFSMISAFAAIPVIAAAVIICSLLCFKITSNLNSYKNQLEIDIENKNKALHEHDEKMLKLQNTTIIGMATLIESRDGDTGEHVKRTSIYVAMLAQAARQAGYEQETLTDSYIELLIKAAPLHDIGIRQRFALIACLSCSLCQHSNINACALDVFSCLSVPAFDQGRHSDNGTVLQTQHFFVMLVQSHVFLFNIDLKLIFISVEV